jgi:hypothetical protein
LIDGLVKSPSVLLGAGLRFNPALLDTKESIISQTYPTEISPNPSFPKRGIPPFCKGREGGI